MLNGKVLNNTLKWEKKTLNVLYLYWSKNVLSNSIVNYIFIYLYASGCPKEYLKPFPTNVSRTFDTLMKSDNFLQNYTNHHRINTNCLKTFFCGSLTENKPMPVKKSKEIISRKTRIIGLKSSIICGIHICIPICSFLLEVYFYSPNIYSIRIYISAPFYFFFYFDTCV